MADADLTSIKIELPINVWGVLALQAHDLDIKLNDHLMNIVKQAVVETKGMKLTPDEWLEYCKDFRRYTIIDPDGWDKENYDESWAEEITKDEMTRRVSRSTVIVKY